MTPHFSDCHHLRLPPPTTYSSALLQPPQNVQKSISAQSRWFLSIFGATGTPTAPPLLSSGIQTPLQGKNGYRQRRLCTHNGPLHLRLMSDRVISGCLAYRTLVRDLVYPESLYKSISNTIPNTIPFTPPCSPRSSTQRVLFINIGKPLISEYRQCKEQAYFSLTYNNSP